MAIRADPFVAALDVFGAAVCTGASMAAFSGLAVTRRSVSIVLVLAVWVLESVVAGSARAVQRSRPPRREASRRVPTWLGGLGRGLFLAIPLVLLFAVLFASADPIFRRGLDDVLGLRIDLGDLPGRLLFIVAVAWFVGGLLSVAAVGIPDLEGASLGAAARPVVALGSSRALGTIEALVVLVGVDLVIAAFVGLQVAYLFGGLDTLAAAGMTYADYARRGYFELVAAAALAGGLLVVLELAVERRTGPYVALAVGLVGLDRRRAGQRGDAPGAVPGRLRLDRAAALRGGVDRGDGGDPCACWRCCWSATGPAGSVMAWPSSGSARSSP